MAKKALQNCACTGKWLDKLLRPYLLWLLAERGPAHGYALRESLRDIRCFQVDGLPDHSGIYRSLKAMEQQGFVVSEIVVPPSGPTRRQYSITKDGRECLTCWGETLVAYRAALDDLVDRL